MEKRVNPRMLVFAAAAMVGAAFCATAFALGIDAKFWIALILSVLFVAAGLYAARNTRERMVFLLAVLLLTAAVGGFCVLRIGVGSADLRKSDATVRCVVASAPTVGIDSSRFGVYTVNRLQIDGVTYRGAAELRIENADAIFLDVPLGAGFSIRHARVESSNTNANRLTDGARYVIVADFTDCLYAPDYRGNFFERIRYSVTNTLRDEFPNSAGVAAALLFGDKSGLGDGEYQAFRLAGLAHALAVSGLHVGFLIAILNFLTAKLRRFRIPCFLLLVTVLIGYAAVCGGAVSVVRAVIMGILTAFAALIRRRADPLNNLAAAAISILCFNPFFVRDLGFVMSFLSVLGILLAARPLTKFLRFVRLPARLASAVAVTTAATLGLLPVTAAYFHTINLWSPLVNLVALPFVMICFVTLFVAAAFVLVGWHGILVVPDFLLRGLSSFTTLCAKLPGADFLLLGFGVTAVPYYVALVMFGGLILFRTRRVRTIACALSFAVLSAFILGVNIPKRYDAVHIGAVGYYDAVASVSVFDGKCCVVGRLNCGIYAKLDSFLAENRIRKVDLLVVAAYDARDAETVNRFAERYAVETAVFDFVEGNPYLDSGVRCDRILVDGVTEIDDLLLESTPDSPNIYLSRGADGILTQNRREPFDRFAEFVASAVPTEAEAYYRNIVTGGTSELPERAFAAGSRLVRFAF